MVFKNITIEGFRSIKDLNFLFSEKGLFAVQGKNGVGKSTLFEALYYSLFGQLLKATAVAEIHTLSKYRDKDYKGTLLVLDLNIGQDEYSIVRKINYGESKESSVTLIKNGTTIPTTDKADAQNKLNTLIGVSAEVFRNSIFFAQKSLRLIDSKDAERREVFDEMFDIDVDKYIEKAKQEYLTRQQTIKDKQSEILSLENTIRLKHDQYTVNKSVIDNHAEKVKQDKLNIIELIQKLESDIKLIPDTVEVVEVPLPDQQEVYNQKLRVNGVKNTVTRLESSINAHVSKPVEGNCPTCGSKLSQDKLKTLTEERENVLVDLKAQHATYSKELQVESKTLADLESAYSEAKEKYDEYQRLALLNNGYAQQITRIKSNIKLHQEHLNNISDVPPISEAQQRQLEITIESHSKKLDALRLECDKLEQELPNYKFWAEVGFGYKGLKSFILEAMLQKLNNNLDTYSEKLGLIVSIDLKMHTKNKSFEINITDLEGVSKTYSSLSGGEQKRVDIILSFALHDTLNKNMSIIVIDELFEGLDEVGLDIAMSLIRDKANKQAVYLITHNINIDLTEATIIEVIKEKNLTKLLF
jgi:DNA repair exonuclease SbcCD ATPase subunit